MSESREVAGFGSNRPPPAKPGQAPTCRLCLPRLLLPLALLVLRALGLLLLLLLALGQPVAVLQGQRSSTPQRSTEAAPLSLWCMCAKPSSQTKEHSAAGGGWLQRRRPHLGVELVRQDELARVELVEEQHLDALRALPLQRPAPEAAAEAAELAGEGQHAQREHESQGEPGV
jgi:hypothetical protein